MALKKFNLIATIVVVLTLVLPWATFASDVDVSVVDITAPTGSVTLAPGGSGAITINMTVAGSQDSTATFKVYTDWTLSGGTFTGANPAMFTVPPRKAQDVDTTFTTQGTVTVAAGQGTGTYTLAVSAFDITNSDQQGGKLKDGKDSSYQVTVTGCLAAAVTQHPASQSMVYGNSATFTAVGSNYTGVKWQVSTNNGGSFADLFPAVTTASLTVSNPIVAMSGYQYRAIFSNNCPSSATTNAATLTVTKADQTINVTTHAPASAVFGTSFTVAATASSGLPVVITTSGICSVDGQGKVTMSSGTGTCTVKYVQAGDANYNAAPELTETVGGQKAAQTITVTTPAPSTAAFGDSFTVAATASSGLDVTIAASGACAGSGSGSVTVNMTSGTGTCTVTYSQAGNDNYSAAAEVASTTAAQKKASTLR